MSSWTHRVEILLRDLEFGDPRRGHLDLYLIRIVIEVLVHLGLGLGLRRGLALLTFDGRVRIAIRRCRRNLNLTVHGGGSLRLFFLNDGSGLFFLLFFLFLHDRNLDLLNLEARFPVLAVVKVKIDTANLLPRRAKLCASLHVHPVVDVVPNALQSLVRRRVNRVFARGCGLDEDALLHLPLSRANHDPSVHALAVKFSVDASLLLRGIHGNIDFKSLRLSAHLSLMPLGDRFTLG